MFMVLRGISIKLILGKKKKGEGSAKGIAHNTSLQMCDKEKCSVRIFVYLKEVL